MMGGTATQGGVAGQLIVTTTAQEIARIDRLFISGIDGAGAVIQPSAYLIADIKVGTKSQFAALPPLPGVMFTQDATGQGYSLGLDTVQPGTDFSVIVANAPNAISATTTDAPMPPTTPGRFRIQRLADAMADSRCAVTFSSANQFSISPPMAAADG